MVQEIYIIEENTRIKDLLEKVLKEENGKIKKLLDKIVKEDDKYNITSVSPANLEESLKNMPSLIIISEEDISGDLIELCKKIRTDEDNSITPIIVLTKKRGRERVLEVLKVFVEYYITEPIDEEILYLVIRNLLRLLYTNRRVSPLTGLPGNVQIQAEMKKRLLSKKTFAILYLDLDNFKAYNDVYGFMKGDEIIKFTGRVITRNITSDQSVKDWFIGHIGGDDFVAIISEADYKSICEKIIEDFDTNVLQYFTDEDKERGYVEVANRRGIVEQFLLTSISIGVVEVPKGKFDNTLEIGEVGAQVNKIAKNVMGSSFSIDTSKSYK